MSAPSPSAIITLSVIFSVVAVLVVGRRCYGRRAHKQAVKVDDWLVLVALLLILALDVCLIVGVARHAIGYSEAHRSDTREKAVVVPELTWIFIVLLTPALGLIKFSFSVMYRRIFVIEDWNYRDRRNATMLTLSATALLWTCAFTFSYLFGCKVHFSLWWNTSREEFYNYCIDQRSWMLAFVFSDFLFNIILIVLPIPLIWSLRFNPRKKFIVALNFLVGGFAVVASLLRLIYVFTLDASYKYAHSDPNLYYTTFVFWSVIEAALTLIAACIPTLHGLLKLTSLPFENMNMNMAPLNKAPS